MTKRISHFFCVTAYRLAFFSTVLLPSCHYKWRSLASHHVTALDAIEGTGGQAIVIARGDLTLPEIGYNPLGVVLSSTQKSINELGDWEFRPNAPHEAGGWTGLRISGNGAHSDAIIDSWSGKILLATIDVDEFSSGSSQSVSLYVENEYTLQSGVRFNAFRRIAQLRAFGLIDSSIAVRSGSSGTIEIFHGTRSGVYHSQAIMGSNLQLPSFTLLAENPLNFRFTDLPIAVGGAPGKRQVIAIGISDSKQTGIISSRQLASGKWSAWSAAHMFEESEQAVDGPIGLTTVAGDAVFIIPHKGGATVLSGGLRKEVPGLSQAISAALDSGGFIVLASCNLNGVFYNQELDPTANTWLGWRRIREVGCDNILGYTKLVRNREGRLLLIAGGGTDNLHYIWQMSPQGDWEREP
jgi:hypothetical protein